MITFAFCALDSHLLSLLLIILPTCQLLYALCKKRTSWQPESRREGGREGMLAGLLPLSSKNHINSSHCYSQSVCFELGMSHLGSAQKQSYGKGDVHWVNPKILKVFYLGITKEWGRKGTEYLRSWSLTDFRYLPFPFHLLSHYAVVKKIALTWDLRVRPTLVQSQHFLWPGSVGDTGQITQVLSVWVSLWWNCED